MAQSPSPDTLVGLIGAADNFGESMPLANRQETILGLCITFMVLSWICVAVRVLVRFRSIKAPGWDDLFVVLSLLTMSVGMISICVSTEKGLGQHLLLIEIDRLSGFFQSFYIFNASYTMSTALIKISLLLQYMRLYRPGDVMYKTCRLLAVFVALWGLAYSVIAWVPCIPISNYWTVIYEPDISGLKCYGYGSQHVEPFKATYESHAAVNMLLDVVVMALPIPLYFEPGAPGRTRLGLVGVIVMGTFVNIFSVWRFATTIEHKGATYPTFDPTWYGPITIVMAGLETASACICASIPVFWGPMVSSASQLLGQIFVTNEIHVTTEHRCGSNDAFNKLEIQGTGGSLGIDENGGGFGQTTLSRLAWVGKEGQQEAWLK